MRAQSNKIVSIIVVTTGFGNYIKPCIDSVKLQTFPDIETIVIDNSLNDNLTKDIIETYSPGLKLHSSPKNLFYCQAMNIGIGMSRGDFILCLNDDVILDKRFIEEAMKGFGVDERIGMVSGKVLRSNKETIDSTGLFLSFCRTAGERGYGLKDKGKFEKAGFVFGVNGAVSFYRKEMLEEIKENGEYFDSDFHIFYEDLDIAWRAKTFGWKGYYIPEAIAYHIRGGTVRQGLGINKPYARRYLNDQLHLDLIKNRYLTIIKNASSFDFLLHFPGIALHDFVMWSYILLFKPQLIRMFLVNTRHFQSALKKRRAIKRQLRLKLANFYKK